MLEKIIFYIKDLKLVSDNLESLCETGYSVRAVKNIKELTKEEMGDNSLLITDYEDKELYCEQEELYDRFLKMPRIGYGIDYRGSAEYVAYDMIAFDKYFLEMVYCRYYKIPLVIAETPRLLIREMSMEDLEDLYALYDTLRDCKYIEQLYDLERETEFTKNYIKNMYGFFGHGLWLVIRKEDNRLIGRAGIENREIDGETEKELGYLIGKTWQQKGYASEACSAIISYAREYLELERLFLCSNKENIPSIHLAEKLGFQEYAKDIDGINIYYMYL